MKLSYINVITENSILIINKILSFFIENNYHVKVFSVSFDEKWYTNILIWLELNENEEISQIIFQVSRLSDVKEVKDMSEHKKQIKYMFNVNCNCKKTLKRISREPDKIIETDKELIFVFILKRKEISDFVSELNNLRLPYTQRVIWLT